MTKNSVVVLAFIAYCSTGYLWTLQDSPLPHEVKCFTIFTGAVVFYIVGLLLVTSRKDNE